MSFQLCTSGTCFLLFVDQSVETIRSSIELQRMMTRCAFLEDQQDPELALVDCICVISKVRRTDGQAADFIRDGISELPQSRVLVTGTAVDVDRKLSFNVCLEFKWLTGMLKRGIQAATAFNPDSIAADVAQCGSSPRIRCP